MQTNLRQRPDTGTVAIHGRVSALGAGLGPGTGRAPDKSAAHPPVLVHIGYPKASSTWLQQRFFAYPENGFWPVFTAKQDQIRLNELLVYPDAFEDPPLALREEVAARCARRPDSFLVPVISAESLVGASFEPNRSVARLIADRLCATLPDARILIVIRDQVAMLRSAYLYRVRGGERMGLRQYLHRPAMFDAAAWAGYNLGFLSYDLIIAYYVRLFGRDRVLTLPLEMLQTDPAAYVEAIIRFAGTAGPPARLDFTVVKSRIPTGSAAVRRALSNVISVDEMNPLSRLLPKALYWRVYARAMRGLDRACAWAGLDDPAKLDRRICAAIGTRFADSNRRTAALTGLDLAAYGYQL